MSVSDSRQVEPPCEAKRLEQRPGRSTFGHHSSKVQGRSVERTSATVPLSRLVAFLGPPSTVARITTGLQQTEVVQEWPCCCKARLIGSEEYVAFWSSCSAHEDIFLKNAGHLKPPVLVDKNPGPETTVNGSSPTADVAKAGSKRETPAPNRLRSFVTDKLVPQWRTPAVALGVAIVVKSVIDSASLVKRAEEAEATSLVDPLTGLYNRRGWNRRVLEERKRLQRYRESIAIFMLDVDGLKVINDSRGHSAGDAALRQVSEILREVTREHDIAARLGGDEFVILTMHSEQAEAETIKTRLERGFAAADLSVSVGVAFVNPEDGIDGAVQKADRAMYVEKEKMYARRRDAAGGR